MNGLCEEHELHGSDVHGFHGSDLGANYGSVQNCGNAKDAVAVVVVVVAVVAVEQRYGYDSANEFDYDSKDGYGVRV